MGGTAVVAAAVVASIHAPSAGGPPVVALVALGVALVTLGLVLGRPGSTARARLGWELQAAGLGIVAVAWVLARPLG